ncbi:MAG: DMT family transporter [Acidobacteriaceae bacterium]
MPWVYLFVASVFEIIWSYSMKESRGFSQPIPTAISCFSAIAGCLVLSVAMKSLPLGTSYAVFTGIGAVGAFLIGTTILGESIGALRICAFVLIIAGILLMKLTSNQ